MRIHEQAQRIRLAGQEEYLGPVWIDEGRAESGEVRAETRTETLNSPRSTLPSTFVCYGGKRVPVWNTGGDVWLGAHESWHAMKIERQPELARLLSVNEHVLAGLVEKTLGRPVQETVRFQKALEIGLDKPALYDRVASDDQKGAAVALAIVGLGAVLEACVGRVKGPGARVEGEVLMEGARAESQGSRGEDAGPDEDELLWWDNA